MDKLRITLVQPNIIWESPKDNRIKINRLLEDSPEVDLVILPEMFTTGFSMNAHKLAEEINGSTTSWLKETALANNYGIMGSIIAKEGEQYFNRLIMTYPCASLKWYNKKHLFKMGGEESVFTAGNKQQVFNFFGWKIMPQICYDLRFPVWSRNTMDYDLLVYVANWPKARREVWLTLLKARAIENQCFVVGVNRIGIDGNGIEYSGDSVLINARGEVILEFKENDEGIKTAEIYLSELKAFKENFPVFKDADRFKIQALE